MTNPKGWAWVSVDPSAGVSPWRATIYCPRCGIEKGSHANARVGLCMDCRRVLSATDRLEWGQREGSTPAQPRP